MRNGDTVTAFEKVLAEYCGATYCISASNGTVTIQASLVALGVKPGDRVAVPPLTHAATTIAVLNVGAVPVFVDVDPKTWLMAPSRARDWQGIMYWLPVSLYGLHFDVSLVPIDYPDVGGGGAFRPTVDDAAQTLRKHSGAAFTSLSFQASKILALGEGGALLTNDEELASRARSYLSLGYAMGATQARIDSHALRSPTFDRHHTWPAVNGRMNDLTAAEGLKQLAIADDELLPTRHMSAMRYEEAIDGREWITQQAWPEGWEHDMWTKAIACDTPERALLLADAVVKHGGERPYPAWRLTFDEPAFRHLTPRLRDVASDPRDVARVVPNERTSCPVAASLQPRLLQFQCNSLASAERNALALRRAIEEIN